MRRGVTSQGGKCHKCGKEIFKAAPWQPWMAKEDLSEICEDGEPHKLEPFKENK
jgi:hypothetical protein